MSAVPYFSVVVPVYNKEPHIARALSSVLRQTYADFELLVVCDPSTDNSTVEVKKFDDPRIRVFHRSQRGPGGSLARNLGIQQARTKWVAFLDADDEWLPDHLKRLNNLAQMFPDQKILSAGWLQRGDEQELDPYSLRNTGRSSHLISRKEYLHTEIRSRRPICTDVACIQRDVLIETGAFPDVGRLGRGGDVDTWFRCVMQAGSLAWSDHIGAIYHVDTVNRASLQNVANFRFYRQNILSWIDRTDEPELRKLLRQREYFMTIAGWVGNVSIPAAATQVFIPSIDLRHPTRLLVRGILIGLLSLLPKRFAIAGYKMRRAARSRWRRKNLPSH